MFESNGEILTSLWTPNNIVRYGDLVTLQALVKGANGPGSSPKQVSFYSNDEFLDFMAEIRGIMAQEDEVSIRLIMFDAAIQYEKMLTGDETEQYAQDRYSFVNRYGYGGTNFNPPLRYMCGEDTDSDWSGSSEMEEQPMWTLTSSGVENDYMQPRVLKIQD